jgi:hypothetical protein
MRLMPQKLGRFLMGLVNLGAVISLALAVQFVLPGGLPATLTRMVAAAALVALYLGGARWIERRRPDELRLPIRCAGLAREWRSGSHCSPA